MLLEVNDTDELSAAQLLATEPCGSYVLEQVGELLLVMVITGQEPDEAALQPVSGHSCCQSCLESD